MHDPVGSIGVIVPPSAKQQVRPQSGSTMGIPTLHAPNVMAQFCGPATECLHSGSQLSCFSSAPIPTTATARRAPQIRSDPLTPLLALRITLISNSLLPPGLSPAEIDSVQIRTQGAGSADNWKAQGQNKVPNPVHGPPLHPVRITRFAPLCASGRAFQGEPQRGFLARNGKEGATTNRGRWARPEGGHRGGTRRR